MTMVRFKTAGLKKFGPGDQREVEAGEEVDLGEGLIARYGDGVERVLAPEKMTAEQVVAGAAELEKYQSIL